MTAIRLFTLLAPLALLAAPVAAPAQTAAADDDIASKIINNPNPAAFQVYNAPVPAKVIKDSKVQGGKALRVQIPAADKDAWKISLTDPITRPVKKGDKIVLAFYARAQASEAADGTVHLPNNTVQLAKEPYTGVFGGPIDIKPEWEMYNLSGVADRDYAAGELGVSMQLASGKQVIDFGPVFVLNLGQ